MLSSIHVLIWHMVTGLEPSEVKYAQGEFRKFDMEGNGQ